MASNLLIFGASVENGRYASNSAAAWTSRFAQAIGVSPTIHAVDGDMAPDAAQHIYAASPADCCIDYGSNDAIFQSPIACLQPLAAWMAMPTKQTAVANGSYTGTWTNTQSYGLGKWSNTHSATATFTVYGAVVYIGLIQQNSVDNVPVDGTCCIDIDGIEKANFCTSENINTPHGIRHAPALIRIPGLSEGSHEVKITITSASGGLHIVYVDWVAGNAQTALPTVLVANIARFTAAGYASLPGSHSDARVLAYSKAIGCRVAELQSDGLDVRLVDVWSEIDPATCIFTDGLHPNDLGHSNYNKAFCRAYVAH